MRFAPNRAWRLAVALALSAPVTACAALPGPAPLGPVLDGASAPKPGAATGQLRLDVGRLFGNQRSGAARSTLGYFGDEPNPVTHVRLTLQYPGHDGAVDLTPTPVALVPAPGVDTTIACDVLAGANRVVTVEALDAEGHTLMRLRAATNVPADRVATIQLNLLQDAVGRVIERMIAESLDPVAPLLDDTNLVGALNTYLTSYTGFNEATNEAGPSRRPQDVESRYLANKLLDAPAPFDWLSAPESLEDPDLVRRGGFFSYLDLNRLSGVPIEWRSNPERLSAKLLAPTNGRWNYNVGLMFTAGDPDELGPYPAGITTRIFGMPEGKHTLVLTYTEPEAVPPALTPAVTTTYYDVTSSEDGVLYFDGGPQPTPSPLLPG